MNPKLPRPCSCGSGRTYDVCCGIYHAGERAPNAELLMRSRYTAYVLHLETYLLATWHPSTRPERLDLHEDPCPRWLGLEIKGSCAQSANETTVEFVARYKSRGRAFRLHEISRFIMEQGQWLYVDGRFPGIA